MSGIEIALGFALMEAGVGGAAAGWIAAGTTTLLPLILGGGAAYASSLLMPEAAREDKVKGGKERVGSTQPRTRIYGKVAVKPHKVHDVVYGADKRQYLAAFAIADHEIQTITQLICDDKKNNIDTDQQGGFSHSVDGYGSGADARLLVAWKTGTTTDTAFAPLVSQAGWSSNHRGRGVAKMFLRASYRAKEFPSRRPPEVKPVVEGAALYNPLLDSTQTGGSGSHRWANKSTWAYSRNAALALYDHLRGNVVNGDLWGGCGYSDDEIDLAAAMSAISVCAATITNPDSTTRPRYAIDYEAVYGREADLVKIAKDILKAMDGVAAWRDGKFWFAAGSDRTPVATLTDDDFHLGDGRVYQVSDARAEGLINEVMGTYTNAAKSYRTKEIKPLRSTSAIAADGRVLSQTVDLPMVTNKYQARQIMRQILERSRLQWNARVSVGARWAMALEAGDIILWQSARWGWTRRFLIKEVDLVIDKGIYANLTLEETASAVWDAETTEYDEGDGYEGEPPPALAAPQNLTATAIYETGDAGKKIASTAVNWTAPDDVTLTHVDFRVRRKTAANNARQYADDWPDPEDGAANVRNGMGVDGQYEIRASFVRGTEPRTRVWTSWVTITSDGDGGAPGDVTPPPVPTGLSYGTEAVIEPKSGQTRVQVEVTWTSVIANDLDQYKIRYRPTNKIRWSYLASDDPVASWIAEEGRRYRVQVRAVDQARNQSAWSTVLNLTATVDKAPPGAVKGAKAVGQVGRIKLTWQNPTNRDLRYVRVYARKGINNRSGAVMLDRVVGNSFIHDDLKPGEVWYYWFLAEDTSGNVSAAYYPASATAGITATVRKVQPGDLDGTQPGTPTGLSVTYEAAPTTDGTWQAVLKATWKASSSGRPSARFRVSVTRTVNETGTQRATDVFGTESASWSATVVPGRKYTVKVAGISQLGAIGSYTATQTVTIPNDIEPPPAPTTAPVAQAKIKGAVLALSYKNKPRDFRTFEIVWSTSGAFTPNSATVAMDDTSSTRYNHDGVPAGTQLYYWFRAVDRTGNKSAWSPRSNLVTIRKANITDVDDNLVTRVTPFQDLNPVRDEALGKIIEQQVVRKAGTTLAIQAQWFADWVKADQNTVTAAATVVVIKRGTKTIFPPAGVSMKEISANISMNLSSSVGVGGTGTFIWVDTDAVAAGTHTYTIYKVHGNTIRLRTAIFTEVLKN